MYPWLESGNCSWKQFLLDVKNRGLHLSMGLSNMRANTARRVSQNEGLQGSVAAIIHGVERKKGAPILPVLSVIPSGVVGLLLTLLLVMPLSGQHSHLCVVLDLLEAMTWSVCTYDQGAI